MDIFDVEQGSPEWKALRNKYRPASEAPIVMGEGFISRDKLLKQKALGIEEEPSEFLAQLWQRGHDAEADARPIIEEKLGAELFPVTAVHEDGKHLASFDGLTEDGTIVFEHKLWNEKLVAMVNKGELTPKYYWQLEQQLYVSGAEKVVFVCSDGTEENMVMMEYKAVRGRMKKLIAAWEQFEKDLQDFEIPEQKKPEVVVEHTDNLPAIKFKMKGMELSSNLLTYKEAAMELVQKSQLPIETDQDFANCEALNKKLKDAESYLDKVKGDVLAEVSSIEQFTSDIEDLKSLLRSARLNGEKQVKYRKDEIRAELIGQTQQRYDEYVSEKEKEIPIDGYKLIIGNPDFAGAIKGKKTVDSLRGALNDALAEAKLDVDESISAIKKNLEYYLKHAKDYQELFPDLTLQLGKEGFQIMVDGRISSFKLREKERQEEQRRLDEEELAAARKREEELKEEKNSLEEENENLADENLELSTRVKEFEDYSEEHPNPANRMISEDASPDEVKQHRYKVHVAIKATLCAYGVDDSLATELVKLMSSGEIPRVKIMY